MYPTRFSNETPQGALINDQKNLLSKKFERISSKNNHYYESDFYINKPRKTCNEFLRIYLMQQTKTRLIMNRFRLFPRRLFKFRRKKSLKFLNQSQNFNSNNHHLIIDEAPKTTIEQILNRQWMQTLKSEKITLSMNRSNENSSCSINNKDSLCQSSYQNRNPHVSLTSKNILIFFYFK
jgi:hypothetical protein